MPHTSWNLQKSKLVLSFCQEAATSCLILQPTSITEVIYVVPFCMNLPESTNLIPTAQTNKLPTVPHQQAAPGNVHVAGRG